MNSLVATLEPRWLLSYGLSSLNSTWNDNAVAQYGSIQFSGAGGITGGTLYQYSGDVNEPSGSYTVASDGAIAISETGTDELTGAVNSTNDVASASESAGNLGYGVYVSSNGAAFNNSSMAGTWTLVSDGNTNTANGIGTLTFDSSGNISSGTFDSGAADNVPVTGSYVISANGVVSLTINAAGKTFVLVGGMNASKDFISQSPYDPTIGEANEEGDPLLMELVRSNTTYSDADVAGTWALNADGFVGSAVTFDAAGHITGGTCTVFNGTASETAAISGTYSLSAAGALTFNAVFTPTGGGSVFDYDGTGAMNTGKNAFIMNEISQTASLDVTDGIKLGTPLFATLSNGVLTITGTGSADTISVTDTAGSVVATLDGESSSPFAASDITGGISVSAGTGHDSVTLVTVPIAATVTGTGGYDTIVGGDGGNSVRAHGIENFITGGTENDTLIGPGGDDTIFAAGAGNDFLKCKNLDNKLRGGTGGDDTLIGGSGSDTLKGHGGNNSIVAGSGDDLIHAREGNNTIVGGAGQETITGNLGNNTITAGAGGGEIVAGTGEDSIVGSTTAGYLADSIYCGSGTDTIVGGSGDQIFDEFAGDSVSGGMIVG